MLEIIDIEHTRHPCVDKKKINVNNRCKNKKCYDCGRFKRCAILNDGAELFSYNIPRR